MGNMLIGLKPNIAVLSMDEYPTAVSFISNSHARLDRDLTLRQGAIS